MYPAQSHTRHASTQPKHSSVKSTLSARTLIAEGSEQIPLRIKRMRRIHTILLLPLSRISQHMFAFTTTKNSSGKAVFGGENVLRYLVFHDNRSVAILGLVSMNALEGVALGCCEELTSV